MTDPDTSRAPQPKFEEVAIDGATPAERISGVARWVVVITTLLSLVLERLEREWPRPTPAAHLCSLMQSAGASRCHSSASPTEAPPPLLLTVFATHSGPGSAFETRPAKRLSVI